MTYNLEQREYKIIMIQQSKEYVCVCVCRLVWCILEKKSGLLGLINFYTIHGNYSCIRKQIYIEIVVVNLLYLLVCIQIHYASYVWK